MLIDQGDGTTNFLFWTAPFPLFSFLSLHPLATQSIQGQDPFLSTPQILLDMQGRAHKHRKWPGQPYGRSGARYSALPHCSRPLPTASGHLGPPQRVSRGRLGVWDTASCRPPPKPLSSPLHDLTRARPWTLPTVLRGHARLSHPDSLSHLGSNHLSPVHLSDTPSLPLVLSCPLHGHHVRHQPPH